MVGVMDVMVADRYRLDRRIADGGMGEVWAGRDQRLNRPVAVKLLRRELGTDPSIRRRVAGEARAAARLMHPNVVAVYDTGTHEGLPYLVMELVPGRTLTEALADGPLAEDRARDLASDVLAALAAAHAEGILHRDVKPGNILLTEDGRAKVADFGIAKQTDAAATETAEVMGTAAYMAPERLEGRPATARCDLYSVGAVLYQALTGRLPFRADAPAAFLDAIRSGHRPALRELRPDVSPGLARVVERALSPEPGGRFGSAEEMAAALDGRVPHQETESLVTPTQALSVPMRRRRRPGPALALFALFVIAFVAAFLVASSLRAPSPSPGGPPPAETSELPPDLDEALDRLEEAVRP